MQSSLSSLPTPSLVHIIDYLDIKDVLFSLSLTCRKIHSTILTSPHITNSLFQKLIGRKVLPDWNLTTERLREILLTYLNSSQKTPTNLPFYGFKGDCGTENDKHQFLFERIFESRESHDLVSTKPGKHFNVLGALSKTFRREANQIARIIELFEADESFFIARIKEMLGAFSIRGFEPFLEIITIQLPLITDNPVIFEILESVKNEAQKFSGYISKLQDKFNLTLPYEEIPASLGLIQSCDIYRGTSSAKCPVKTLVAFASAKGEISFDDPLVSLFNCCQTSKDFETIRQEHIGTLPSISQTSIKSLSKEASKYKENQFVEYAVFNSNGLKEDVIPLFWITFNNSDVRKTRLEFEDTRFSAKYVLVKMLDCDNVAQEVGEGAGGNIDVHYCSFNGQMLYL